MDKDTRRLRSVPPSPVLSRERPQHPTPRSFLFIRIPLRVLKPAGEDGLDGQKSEYRRRGTR